MLLRLGATTLDLHRRMAVMAIVNRGREAGVTIILIEHVMRFLVALLDRGLIMHHGGATYALEASVDHALAQVEEGADLVDVGGVKAGPGEDVDTAAELDRIVPFVEAGHTHE